ncbi:MAG: glycosyltransferase family 4 protein [Bacilli bacterium]
MKIMHLCLASVYTEGFSYQENLLAKYHKKLNLEVEIVTNCWMYDENGKIVLANDNDYVNKDGVHVIRLKPKFNQNFSNKFIHYNNLSRVLKTSQPDILFIHNLQFIDIDIVVKYLKENKNVIAYLDNHADFTNSARSWLSKNILHKIIWRRKAQKIKPYIKKFYGVLPARVDFLVNVYKLPKEKCELLIMGADDEMIEDSLKLNYREKIRKKYGVHDDDFLIISGGKIDFAKKDIIELAKAVKNLNNNKIKLLIFGSIVDGLKDKLTSLFDDNIIYIGWLSSNDSYKYFSAADLVVFPGRHSVYWEQVVAQGIPLLCQHIIGVNHIDIGGNVLFANKNNIDEYKEILNKLVTDKEFYNGMKRNANKEEKDNFLYSKISKKSIEWE